ncbi:hypothetical protein GCM10009096_02390 [Parasphingorhabdus litoris]|uniref:Uncharacterized protein n=1 Tax=Parasphingorhabdus litoris TaxID=394733 RepID=A0ABN1A1M8_9SPHN|nr:hypothetical protein [Parasphingorhabdus litoris]
MDASAQTDEDLRKRVKAAKHDKKHKTHGAHDVATLGADISQRKIDKLHKQLGEHAPAYKPKTHALKKTHPAHRETGSHAIISSKSAQAAGRWGYPEPAIDFVGIAQRRANGPSSFVGPDNRRLTNAEVASFYDQGIITPRGLPAAGQAQTVRFVPAGMFAPPELQGITVPNTATSQLSKAKLPEQIQSNPNGVTAFVAN